MAPQKKMKAGFTLVEMITVVAILGIISAIAWPRISIVVEKMRAQEAVQIAQTLYGSQRRYAADNGGTFANDPDLLDVTINHDSAEFDPPEILNGAGAGNHVVKIEKTDNSYWVAVNTTGTLLCGDTEGGGLCSKLGL